jgi:hypothetical protein
MVIIWAVSFVALLTVAFGTIITVLCLNHKQYGIKSAASNVEMVTYYNANTTNHHGQLLNVSTSPNQAKAVSTILSLLDKGGKTNKFKELFRGNPGQTLAKNNTSVGTVSTFETTYAKNAIKIRFNETKVQHYIVERDGKYALSTKNEGIATPIYEILIPLDKNSNRFQEQIWYINTNSPISLYGTNLSYKLTTYGNYHKLWEYVSGCNII